MRKITVMLVGTMLLMTTSVYASEWHNKTYAAHIDTPTHVRAVYMSQCAASSESFRNRILRLITETELNAVVIDIKDSRGGVGFKTDHHALKNERTSGCRVENLQNVIGQFHKKGIYVIVRLTVFQDPKYAKKYPQYAVKTKTGGIWKDRKGLLFIDVGAKPFWDYIVTLSREAHRLGADEINYDYIRYPSDGNLRNTKYEWSDRKRKADELERFFIYLHREVKDTGKYPSGIDPPKISADLFGMVTTNRDHLGIGQVLEKALPYFDYIAPMVYPSHWPNGFNGWKQPGTQPYNVIKFVMEAGVRRVVAAGYPANVLRPWLQDFSIHGISYGPNRVRAQIDANTAAGLGSYMLWDPRNKYTRGALKNAPSGQAQIEKPFSEERKGG